ncbi:MAG TPA: amidohydrolase family protein, partial [Myxococcota bacterium]|nr:amidohydrolase family protein [Myxococcota bacterium]
MRLLAADGPDQLRWVPDAWVAWDELGRLTDVAPWDGQPYDEDLRPHVLTAGFVDGHVHFPQARIVGSASGPLLDWLARSTFPEEERFADPAHAARVATWFCRRMAASGTTLAFVYGSVHPRAADRLFRELAETGLRAIAGPVLMDEGGPDALMLGPDPALAALEALGARWHGYDGRLRVAAIPRFGLSCSADMMRRAGDLARERGWWVSTHLSENPDEVRATCEKFGAPDYLSVYEDAGLVHERCVLAHCIHPTGDEWSRMAAARVVVAHCPDSNDFLGSGGMPVARVLDRGLPLVLGTDVAAGRSQRVPRIASSAHDNALRQGRRVSPVRWLWAATRGGAMALGEERLGALAPGF